MCDDVFLLFVCLFVCLFGNNGTASPQSVIDLASFLYRKLRIVMTVKLMIEAVKVVAICGVTYINRVELELELLRMSLSCEKEKNTANRYTMMPIAAARINSSCGSKSEKMK